MIGYQIFDTHYGNLNSKKGDNMRSFKIIFGTVVSAAAAYLGGIDGVLITLLAFISVDYVSGVVSAVKEKRLSSEVGFWGLVRKVFILALVGVGNLLDVYVIGSGAVFRTAVALYYIGNEGVSILENSIRIGLPVPKKLKDILIQLKNEVDKDESKCDRRNADE